MFSFTWPTNKLTGFAICSGRDRYNELEPLNKYLPEKIKVSSVYAPLYYLWEENIIKGGTLIGIPHKKEKAILETIQQIRQMNGSIIDLADAARVILGQTWLVDRWLKSTDKSIFNIVLDVQTTEECQRLRARGLLVFYLECRELTSKNRWDNYVLSNFTFDAMFPIHKHFTSLAIKALQKYITKEVNIESEVNQKD